MRECRTSGSVRGALSNERPYRDYEPHWPPTVRRRPRGRRRSVGRGVRRLGQRAAKQMSSWVSTLSRKGEDNTAHRASASGVPAQRGPEPQVACAYALCPGTGRSGGYPRPLGLAGLGSRREAQ